MDINEFLIKNFRATTTELTTKSNFLESLRFKMADKNNFHKANYNRLVYSDTFANDYFYQSSKTWCNTQSDYCPFVIALISVIIFITLILIIFLCVKNSIQCRSLRLFTHSVRSKIFNSSTSSASQCNPQRSNLQTLAALRNPTVSRQSRSAFRHITNHLSQSDRNIWFTGNTKTTPPPPTYEESLNNINNIRSSQYLHKNSQKLSVPFQTSNVNNAFSIESINETSTSLSPSAMFPTYRCLALTTSPSTRAQLQRLSNLSRQLLQENRFNFETTSALVRVGTLNINNDEVPPDYETVIKSTQNLENLNQAQISSVEILI